MSVSEIIKTIDNKIEQNKAQYNLDRQNAKISGNVNKYEFLTRKDVLLDLLKKIVYNNTKKLCSILLNIYFNDCNNITDEEKERMGKIMILKIYLLKNKVLLSRSK